MSVIISVSTAYAGTPSTLCGIVNQNTSRMWGTPTDIHGHVERNTAYAGTHHLLRQGEWDRNTPAYAGNTWIWPHKCKMPKEHPRVCGEHHRLEPAKLLCAGTPPRMRGTRSVTIVINDKDGNTPAYAGNTKQRKKERTEG